MHSAGTSNVGILVSCMIICVSLVGLALGTSAFLHYAALSTGGVRPAAYMDPRQATVGSAIGLLMGVFFLVRAIQRRH